MPDSRETDITVRFWGVRGSIACPGADTVRYGGNTSCVEVSHANRVFIFDAGTGLRALGESLLAKDGPVDADLFFSHTHMDHVCGLPFFRPAFLPDSRLRFWAGHLLPEHTLKGVLSEMMQAPLFPVPLDILQAQIDYQDFPVGTTLTPMSDVTLRTAPLNHPNGATGYRFECAGKAVAYLTDTEHKPHELDRNVLALADGVELMIYDCTYTDEEYPSHVHWGHSTWQQAVKLAKAARAKTLAIFHHDPGHDDSFMDKIAADAQKALPGTVVAREGMVLRL
ncbi:MAG TPA: MBL fold metallo-hydrolase [Stellaceae bacterium]|nr:MBL fold metallo-hydrolase [Stellaceae bacterium]